MVFHFKVFRHLNLLFSSRGKCEDLQVKIFVICKEIHR